MREYLRRMSVYKLEEGNDNEEEEMSSSEKQLGGLLKPLTTEHIYIALCIVLSGVVAGSISLIIEFYITNPSKEKEIEHPHKFTKIKYY